MHAFHLRLGLPHTSFNNLSEYHLMMHAGHFQWAAIADTIGVPLSALRTVDGKEVYATFYFIETELPEQTPLNSFLLDDDVTFQVRLRSFKNVAVEGTVMFDRTRVLEAETAPLAAAVIRQHPHIRFANVFITPADGNSRLKVAAPANGAFTRIAPMPNAENPYNRTREAERTGHFGLFESDDWSPCGPSTTEPFDYAINPDRDSNGAGLLYFASYFAFMDMAERAIRADILSLGFSSSQFGYRTLRHRVMAYYGNARLDEHVLIAIRLFRNTTDPDLVGFRYRVTRSSDGATIGLSEAIKSLSHGNARYGKGER